MELYILAHRLLVQGLRDQIITALVEGYGFLDGNNFTENVSTVRLSLRNNYVHPFWDPGFERPTWLPTFMEGLDLAFERLPIGDPLRRLLMLLFCDNVKKIPDKTSIYVVRQAYQILVHRNERARDWPINWDLSGMLCNFHIHDVPCTRPSNERKGTPFRDDEALERADCASAQDEE